MRSAKGFTLIELLIVIAIIGILASVLIPNLLNARKRANDTVVLGYVRNVVTAVEASRDPATGGLETSKKSCGDYVSPQPALIGLCLISYIHNGSDFKVEAWYEGGTRNKAVYENGAISLQSQ